MRPILNVAVFKIGSFFFFEMALEMQKNVKKKQTNNFGLFRYTLYKYVVGGNNNHDCICSMSERESPEKK